MRIVVTGAGGFIGSHLLPLLDDHEVIAADSVGENIPKLPFITKKLGDLTDQRFIDDLFEQQCDAVIHLASIPGGAAEQNPELGKQVNIDATINLAARAAQANRQTRFIFGSSIAVFSGPYAKSIDDRTPLSPTLLYGAHKAMMEQWLATLHRRGDLNALSIRLSGIVARPPAPSGHKSAYLSNVFHAIRSGNPIELPTDEKATSWLISLEQTVKNIAHCLAIDFSKCPEDRAVTLPAQRVVLGELVNEIARQSNQDGSQVSYRPEQEIQDLFGSYPLLENPAADSLGFNHDGDLKTLVSNTLRKISP